MIEKRRKKPSALWDSNPLPQEICSAGVVCSTAVLNNNNPIYFAAVPRKIAVYSDRLAIYSLKQLVRFND